MLPLEAEIKQRALSLLIERDGLSLRSATIGIAVLIGAAYYFKSPAPIFPFLLLLLVNLFFCGFTLSALVQKRRTGAEHSHLLSLYRFNYLTSGITWGALLWPIRNSLLQDPISIILFVIVLLVLAFSAIMTTIYPPALKRFVAGYALAIIPCIWQPLNDLGYFLIAIVPIAASIFLVLGLRIGKQTENAIRVQIENEVLSEKLAVSNRELIKSLRVAETLSRQDSLTGLLNRRAFEESVRETDIYKGANISRHILLLDLDKFKQVNDDFGHAAGDKALVSTAHLIPKLLGRGALVARWGGEEFIMMTIGKSPEEVSAIAEDLRVAVSKLYEPEHEALKISASIGISTLDHGGLLAAAVADADRALYAAKAAGRNRVKFSIA